MTQPIVLLTGASGFVGRHTASALHAAGCHVRALSRSPSMAQRGATDLEWFKGDLESSDTLRGALRGVDAAVYLYHAIGSGSGYATRETQVAQGFQRSADEAGVKRIVYLGGVAPPNASSRHLESRRASGEILRRGSASAIELRASMVIGHGSASFTLIRDLVVRAPVIALPPWLDFASCPISICDVAPAIAVACLIPSATSSWYELPGPECLSHRALIGALAGPLGARLLERPLAAISPRLAAWGIARFSDVSSKLSRELIEGLTTDLRPTGPSFWAHLGEPELRPLRHAIVDALSDEFAPEQPGPETRRRIARKTVDWLARAGVPLHA